MSVILKIKNVSEELKPQSLVPGELEYGVYDDAYRLKEANGEDSIMVFDPKHIGRGICIEKDTGDLILGLSLPAGANEIALLYRLLRRALKKLEAKEFFKDDAAKTAADIEALEKEDLAESEAELKDMTEKISQEKNKVVTIFGALNPITLSADDLGKFEGKIEKLEKHLHNKQMVNAYYAAPQFFQDPQDGSFVGVYNIMVGVDTIMPFEPSVPFYMEGSVDRWYVYVYISDEQFGYVKFSDFINKAPRNGFYDAVHFFCNLGEEQADQLIKNYGAEV